MYLSIIMLPLLGSFASGLLGRKIGVTGSHIISCVCLVMSSILITTVFYEVCLSNSPVYVNIGSWIDSELLTISWEFSFDQLTVGLAIAVLFCSTLIHIYSIYYLPSDPHNQRFFSYLSAFTFGMLVLITGANFFVMFVGWEIIGLVSYLLINFYFTRIQSNKAAILAFTMNRQGDMLLSIGFMAIFALFGSLNYSSIFAIAPYMNETALTIIALLLFGGACAKSAQLPLHSWLPGSMEAKHNTYIIFFLIYLLICICSYIYVEGYSNISQNLTLITSSSDLAGVGYSLPGKGLLALRRGCEGVGYTIFCLIIPTVPVFNSFRDSKGRFRTPSIEEKLPLIELSKEIMDPLIGNLLGDGSLRFTHKSLNGKPKLNTNALYAMTLKNKEYTYHLWQNLYNSICTNTVPRPWPNPKTGKPATQFTFSTKSLSSLTLLHSQWYNWSEVKKGFVKIVPLNIEELLTPIGLAIWIMDDGFKAGKGVVLCTESFSLAEVELLKKVLESKFELIVTIQVRHPSGGGIGYRLSISSKSRDKLLSLVQPYFIPSMNYKLGI